MKEFRSPTNLVWILGRTYCDGTPADYDAVHTLQAKYSLTPLSSYGKSYTPPPGKVDPNVDMTTPPRDQVNRMTAQEYFGLLATLDEEEPAHSRRRSDGREARRRSGSRQAAISTPASSVLPR